MKIRTSMGSRRPHFVACLPLVIFAAWCGHKINQHRIAGALQDAITHGDAIAARYALNAGADPNTVYCPGSALTPTRNLAHFYDAIRGVGGWSKENRYPTALLLVYWPKYIQYSDGSSCVGCMRTIADNPALVRTLLEFGADIRSVDEDGNTALHRACECANIKSVEVLLEHHADPNAKAKGGFTPLMSADAACARLLINYGAMVSIRNEKGDTSLDLARLYGSKALVSLLTDAQIRESATH